RIGIETNYISMAHGEELVRGLPHAQFVDCVKMMDEVRWLKTPREIELLKEGADLLDEVYLEVFQTTNPADTERKVHSRIGEGCLRRGAGWVHGLLSSSTNMINYGGESDVVLRRGDMIRDDYIAYCTQGYPGHQSRNVILGKPTPAQAKEYDALRVIYEKTIK